MISACQSSVNSVGAVYQTYMDIDHLYEMLKTNLTKLSDRCLLPSGNSKFAKDI